MPYPGEYAQYRSIRKIVTDQRVHDTLASMGMEIERRSELTPAELPESIEITPSTRLPKWVVAIDGGQQEVPIQNGFPSAEVSYLTVSSVMLNVEKLNELDRNRPIDPRQFRQLQQADTGASVFPGCNVVLKGHLSAEASLRYQLLNTLREQRMADDGESLLATYEALLKYKNTARQNCPYPDCPKTPPGYMEGTGEYKCDCRYGRSLYSTDALRIHEGMNPEGPNGAAFAEIRQVLERLWLVNVLRTIEQKGWLSSLKRLAFVLDGPLAVFGHPAWLKDAIQRELQRINTVARQQNGEDLFLLGIEKTGTFPTHLLNLDIHPNGSPGRIRPGACMLITDLYIKRNIVFNENPRPYGYQTYFGRKFFYKTRSGALIVGVTPFLDESHCNLDRAVPEQHPRLPDVLSLLDHLVSSRFPNAVIPLIEAHAEAAIPLNLGRRILEQLARELVDDGTYS